MANSREHPRRYRRRHRKVTSISFKIDESYLFYEFLTVSKKKTNSDRDLFGNKHEIESLPEQYSPRPYDWLNRRRRLKDNLAELVNLPLHI